MMLGSEVSSNTATSAASGACSTAAIIAPMPITTYTAGADASPPASALPRAPSKPPSMAPMTSVGPIVPTGIPTPTQAAEATVLAASSKSSVCQASCPVKASAMLS